MQGNNLRKIIIGAIIIIGLSVVLLRGDQLIQLIETVQKGYLPLLILALVSQLGKYVCQSHAYSAAFKTVGEKRKPREMLPLVFGAYFLNTLAPSLNMAGMGLVIDDSRRRGIPAGHSTSAALLMQMSIESGFLFIMICGFTVLQFTGHLDPLWLLMLLFVVFLVGAMAGIMIIGRKNSELVVSVLQHPERILNNLSKRFRKGKEVDPWATKLVKSFSEAGVTISQNPRKAALVFLFSIGASICELGCFTLVGLAFGLTMPSALIGGYVVATLFTMISVTPQGIGVVEVITVALLAAYGVPVSVGTAVVLTYRGFVFWMPFVTGAILIHRTKSFSRETEKKRLEEPQYSRLDHRLEPGEHEEPSHEPLPEQDEDLSKR